MYRECFGLSSNSVFFCRYGYVSNEWVQQDIC